MVKGDLTRIDGVDCYRIDDIDHMDPFLMNVVSSSDLWMFASSRGTLTAGRIDANHAFLPYETDDRIHRAVGITGPITMVARTVEGRRELWRPFGAERIESNRRSLSKSVLSDRLIFEETNEAWGMAYRATWTPSPTFGWVRRVELTDLSGSGATVEVLDGLLDVMPPSVDAVLEQLRSNLVDAYKRSETGRWHTAAVYSLESLILDRAEPGEALSATLIWHHGGPSFDIHLDERVVDAMTEGQPFPVQRLLTGRRGSYLLRGDVDLGPGETTSWSTVADIGLGHADIVDRVLFLRGDGSAHSVEADIAAGSERLRILLDGADGFQHTGDPIADTHHLSNVMFNVMRGGLFPHGQQIPVADLVHHIGRWNHDVHRRHSEKLHRLGEWIAVDRLRSTAVGDGDPHLNRLVLEYLPLAFSRRHGDPSRPWNRFSINVRGDSGEEVLGYEGNWRDIFQNWEALLISHPSFIPNVVAKFVNASTLDGHNPYRITHDGVDWEVPDPHDPWANIGYWGDHQIVYLHRLVELWERMAPGDIGAWLNRDAFVYSDVPYIIANHFDMVQDPRNTITYDRARADLIDDRVGHVGSDGRLVVDPAGEIVRVGLMEKLLVPVLAKLSSFVPGGGIWMNTQRPEWNDANNALAGFGLSMVTLYHLFGYVRWLQELVKSELEDAALISTAVKRWMIELTEVLEAFGEPCHTDDRMRRDMMRALGAVGDRHRAASRAEFDATPSTVTAADIERLLSVAVDHLQCAIDQGRRPDGLFDSYHVVDFPSEDEAALERLGPMLEGQVAVLSSGLLDAGDSLALIDALYASGMYRADQDTFMLYPVTDLQAFPDRNRIPDPATIEPSIVDILLGAGVVDRDRNGDLHFSPGMVNGAAVRSVLNGTVLDAMQREGVLDLYESVFNHHSYTGRSGSMHGYEGIGSIYWHMVGKLLVAVQETYWRAIEHNEPEHAIAALAEAYRKVRAGLGFCKSPIGYGAIPTDCYSHTPAHAGAQQPGMTGHVKELIITRFGELGLRITGGRISLAPGLLEGGQTIADTSRSEGAEFSYCGTRMEVTWGDEDRFAVERDGEWSTEHPGLVLPRDLSAEILGHSDRIRAVRFIVARA
jgi:hypothetical protein